MKGFFFFCTGGWTIWCGWITWRTRLFTPGRCLSTGALSANYSAWNPSGRTWERTRVTWLPVSERILFTNRSGNNRNGDTNRSCFSASFTSFQVCTVLKPFFLRLFRWCHPRWCFHFHRGLFTGKGIRKTTLEKEEVGFWACDSQVLKVLFSSLVFSEKLNRDGKIEPRWCWDKGL